MHRFPQGLMATSMIALAACGSPGGLNEDQFPPAQETGYLARDGIGASGAAGVGAGNGGSTAVAGNGPTAPPPGNGGSNGVLDPVGGASGGGSDVVDPDPTGGDPPDDGAGGCPPVEDLLGRPASQGGCTGGCHEAGLIVPDLTSPNVGERLLNLTSMCDGRPYIGAGDSFLAEKISSDPDCGFAMPYLQAGALNDDDRECILQWVERVASGGS